MNLDQVVMPALAVVTITHLIVDGGSYLIDVATPPVVEGSGVADGPGRPGETITVEWSIIKRTNCPGKTSRTWEGADGFYMVEPFRNATLPVLLERETRNIPTKIPETAPPGPANMTIRGYYDCGTRQVYFDLDPVRIEILPPLGE